MAKRILAIVRASTEHQETESQKKELTDFILKLPYDRFTKDEIEYIEVKGASARKENKEYLQMLEEIKQRLLASDTMKTVALWHLNRLGRVKSKLTEMEKFFKDNRIQMYVKHGFDMPLLDENGKETIGASIAFSVYSAMVELETEEMFAKFARGKARLKEQGKYAGGQLHFGYKIDNNRTYIIDEEQAAIVREIFDLYSTGKYSIYKLVDELNHRGVVKRGQKITYNIVRNILVDDSYLGYQSKNQREWLPIIDKEKFDKCALIRKNTIAIKKTTKESRNINFGVGLLKCECGNNFIAYGSSYTCYGKVNNHRKKKVVDCDAPVMPRRVIDEILVLLSVNLHHSFLMNVDSVSIAEYEERKKLLETKIANVKRDIEAAQGRKEKLDHRYYVKGDMSEKQYEKLNKDLNSEISKSKSLIANYKNELKQVETIIEQLSRSKGEKYLETLLTLNYDTDDMDDRKRLKEMMFQHINDVRLKRFTEGKHKCIEITVNTANGQQYIFIYDTWLNNHRKKESYPIFLKHNGSLVPLRYIENDMAVENEEVNQIIEANVGLPTLTDNEQRESTHSLVRRKLIQAAMTLYKRDHNKDDLTEREIELITKQVNENLGF